MWRRRMAHTSATRRIGVRMVGLLVVFRIGGYFPHKHNCSSLVNIDTAPDKELHHSSVVIKKRGGSYGNISWNVVDWQDPISSEESSKFACTMTPFKSFASGEEAQMCVHTFSDLVSNEIKSQKRWPDCNILPDLWNVAGKHDDKDESYYIDIGANIGSCVMEMLLGTNARIIAFEPHPMNLYNLKVTVSKLDRSYQDRLMLFPVGLGASTSTSTIYAGEDNIANSVIGNIVKDYDAQQFKKDKQFMVQVERLDSILDANAIKIKLVKMDAQGFECFVLDGMGADLAQKIDVIKFEYAKNWLDGLGCVDLIPRLNKYFKIYRGFSGGQFSGGPLNASAVDKVGKAVFDLLAVRRDHL
ncbi:hypothetical protein ACHAWF_011458 [Thalassiosira exigua]